jgi:glycosyltransferase involved in cell wall biosynthesis
MVSIVLPVHNQADHIAPAVQRYEEAFEEVPLSREFVLVENASTDHSLEICCALAERYPSVRVVHSDRGGWGLAVRLGLEAARGDLLGYTNSARTGPSDLVLVTLYAVANPGAVVKAHRRSRESWDRRIGSLLYNLECRALFDLPTWDINATPKVFSREVYEAIRPSSDGDLIDLEVYLGCKTLGSAILEVPIYFSSQRHGGRSTTNYRSALGMYTGAYRMWRRRGQNERRGSTS